MRKKLLGAALLLAALLSLCGCGNVRQAKRSVFAMDTYMQLSAYGTGAEAALDEALKQIESFESAWSTTLENSEVSRLNRGETVNVSEETRALLLKAKELSEYTAGAYDPTVYPLVRAWGFTTGDYKVPDQAELQALLKRKGMEKLVIEDGIACCMDGAQIDLGGIAKGYTGDRICALLKSRGVKHALINLGGNVQALGAKPDGSPWRIGIRSPYDETLLGVAEIKNECVITSGAYERCFTAEDGTVYGHIISPETGKPVDNGTLSVSVVCAEGVRGDALSTALFVMGAKDALEFWKAHEGFELIILSADGTLYLTEGLTDSFEVNANSAVKTICTIKR